jgi:hypothetical protein
MQEGSCVSKRFTDKTIKDMVSKHFLSRYNGSVTAGVRIDLDDTADGNNMKKD